MVYDGRTYSVLLVSSSEKTASSLTSLLKESGHSPVEHVKSVSAAKRAMIDRTYDFVIINSPVANDPAVRLATDACDNKTSVVLMLVKAENEEEIIEKTCAFGVLTLPKPTNSQMIITALRWMASIRERLCSYETRTLSLEDKMAQIRTVNRAKLLLIEKLDMTEDQAHHYIERHAMDECISKLECAEEIIRKYS